jgi:hypothetical protein
MTKHYVTLKIPSVVWPFYIFFAKLEISYYNEGLLLSNVFLLQTQFFGT